MNNKIHDALDTVRASEALKASTKEYLRHGTQKRAVRKYRPAVYKTVLAACAMLFLVIGIGGYSFLQTPVSYVSIDVNPSIELALNRFDRVLSATAFNKDGEAVLEGLSVKGKTYTQAIDQILACANMQSYLTGEADLVFTVAAGDGDKGNELLTGIENCSGSIKHDGHGVCADMETVASAHHNGLSLGKYTAYLKLAQYDSTVTVEDCHHMSMAQIHGLIREHESEQESGHTQGHGDDQESGNTKEHGDGQESGHTQEHGDGQESGHAKEHGDGQESGHAQGHGDE